MNPQATPAPQPVDPIDALRDFPDRLSPILVKELRQGLRQSSFVIMFLFLQGVMAMAVISALCAVSSSDLSNRVEMGQVISASFFGLFGLAVLVIQPLRGLGALATEIRDNTIDLLLLTRLDAWRIVVGKWLCLVTQSALLLVAIMPYLMMRYFLGGMNLLSEMGWLTLMFLFGAMICAGGVAMSAVRSVILRTISAVAGVIGFIIFIQGFGVLFAMRSMGSRASSMFSTFMGGMDWFAFWAGILLLIAFLTYSFLEFAATRIAPPAENRSRLKRLIAIASLFIIPAILIIPDINDHFICHVAILLIAPITLADALSENPHYVRSSQHRDWLMLRPGWPSGACFGILILVICAAWQLLLAAIDSSNSDTHLIFAQGTFMGLLIISQPPLLMALMRPRDNDPATLYLTILLTTCTLGLVMMIIAAVSDNHEWVCNLIYPFLPILGLGTLDDPSIGQTIASLLCCLAYLIAAAVIGLVKWRPVTIIKPPATRSPA